MASEGHAAAGVATSVVASGATHAGRVRAVNQDSWFAGPIGDKGFVAVVADGMGGHKTGEVASQRAVAVLREELGRSRKHPPHAIAHAAQAANEAVYSLAQSNPEHEGMGTTLTAVFIDDQVGLVGHVGDSRAYLFRGDEIRQLTWDHSWVAERVRQGLLSEDEARRHRWRNVITNALGATPGFRLDLLHFEVEEGDRVLVCSDGVTLLLSDEILRRTVREHPPAEAADKLIAAANERGSPDNVTAVVLRVDRLERREKRYDLPETTWEPDSVDIGDTLSGLRRVEEEFPSQTLLSKLRRQPWYPYRIWILGSFYLVFVFLLFSLWGR
jgi:protein phosphatase